MRTWQKTFVLIGLALLCHRAFAGEFRATCYGNVNASLFKDIVTDKFTEKYPSSRFTIVVISNFQRYSNGGGVGFAVAGVVPKNGNSKNYEFVPIHRFMATTARTAAGEHLTAKEAVEKEKETARDAVADLMSACDLSPNCEVIE
jgi:hypothetical protein